VSKGYGITGGESGVRPLQPGSKPHFVLTVLCRVGSDSGSLSATDNDVAMWSNATLGVEDTEGVWGDFVERPSTLSDDVDESDDEDEYTFPGAETIPTRETPPSPSPQPPKSTLNPAAIPFTFRPTEVAKPVEVPQVEEPPELPEPAAEIVNVHHAKDDSEDEEFHFPGAEKLSNPIPAPVASPSPQEPVQMLSPVPENPLSVGPSSLAATSPAITAPHSPDLGPLSQISTSASTPAPASPAPVIVSPSPPRPSPPQPPRPLKRKPTQPELEALYAAASSNDLRLLQQLFRNARQSEDVEEFALANDAAVRTGLTALHAAATRGYLDIVQWRKLITV
jgi:hypothetical protein